MSTRIFARWLVTLAALFLLGYASAAALPAGNVQAQARPQNVVYVRDYARGDCQADDTAAINTAFRVFVQQQRARAAGTLDFGSGCYSIAGTLDFSTDVNAPWFGTVRGDGPETTVLRGTPGVTTMQVRNYKYGEFGGIKFSGGPGAGNLNRDGDLNHGGLLIGSDAPQMGVNGVRFHNLTFEHYSVGLGVGDWRTAGSAAENTFDNIGVAQSHIGVMLAGFNTLDNVFHVLNVSETDLGVYSDTAYTAQFYGGSGSNNSTTFYIAACCEWLIEGWREEYGANSNVWIQYGSPAAPTRLIVRGSNTVDTLNPHRAFAEAIRPLTSASAVQVESSMLNGAVGGKYVSIRHSGFTNGNAVTGSPASLEIVGSCLAEINAGQCSQDLPNQLSNVVQPQPQPTATATPVPVQATATPTRTPVPATATPVPAQTFSVRWDAVGPLSTTARSSLAELNLTASNVGIATWSPSTVRATYWWIDSAGAVALYGDQVAIPRSVAPGSALTMDESVVTPSAPGQYRLHLVLMQTPNNWSDVGRDVQVTIT